MVFSSFLSFIYIIYYTEQHGNASPVPKALQELQIVDYDTSQFPFRKAIASILNVEETELGALHETEQGLKALREEEGGSQQRRRGKQPYFVKLWTRAGQTDQRNAFNQVLENFVREVVTVNMQTSTHPGNEILSRDYACVLRCVVMA